jgi:hypothetical protein
MKKRERYKRKTEIKTKVTGSKTKTDKTRDNRNRNKKKGTKATKDRKYDERKKEMAGPFSEFFIPSRACLITVVPFNSSLLSQITCLL